jgi:glycosyltransferase involved in cell wall biosynthesis
MKSDEAKNPVSLSSSRVAWVTPVLGMDGRLLYFGTLLQRFSQECGDFCVFTSEFRGTPDNLPFKVMAFGFLQRLYRLGRHASNPDAKYARGLSFSVVLPSRFRSLIKWNPTLIIVNEFSLTSFYALLAKRFVCHARSLLLVECKPRVSESALLSRIRSRFRRYLARQADMLLTNNSIGRDYLINDLGVDPGRIIMRPYLVSDLAATESEISRNIAPKELPHSRRIAFLYVGQLFYQKGVDLALKAFASLPGPYQDRYCFHIVGDGPNRKALEDFVAANGMSDRVVFHGRQAYESLSRYYDDADVFIFPTTNDYRALVPFEAIGRGLPILGSIHDGGILETVMEGENGFSFDPYNTEYLRELILRFIDQPALIPRFSRRSLELSGSYSLPKAIATLTAAAQQALNVP